MGIVNLLFCWLKQKNKIVEQINIQSNKS